MRMTRGAAIDLAHDRPYTQHGGELYMGLDDDGAPVGYVVAYSADVAGGLDEDDYDADVREIEAALRCRVTEGMLDSDSAGNVEHLLEREVIR